MSKLSVGARLYIIILLSFFIVACGSGGKKQDIKIDSSGGSFTSADGKVTLIIPEDALVSPTSFTITAISEYPEGAIANTVYDITPDQLSFLTSVELNIKYDENDLPAGIEETDLFIAKLIDGRWVEIAEYSHDTEANIVKGKINSLSTFGIVYKASVTGPGEDIDSAGGTITSSDGKLTLEIPEGALDEVKNITVSTVSDYPAGVISDSVFNFGPDGLIFKTPITFTIKYDEANLPDGVTEADLWIGELSEGQWFRVPGSTVDTENNTVSVQISSFSIYGIGFGSDLSKADLEAFVVDAPEAGSNNQFDNIPAAIDYLNTNLAEDETGKVVLQTDRELSVATLNFQRAIFIEIAQGSSPKIVGPGTAPLVINGAGSIGLSGLAISNEGGLQLNAFGNLQLSDNSLPGTTINLGGGQANKPLAHRKLSSRQDGVFGDRWDISSNAFIGPLKFLALTGIKGQLDFNSNDAPRIDVEAYALAATAINADGNLTDDIYFKLTMGHLAYLTAENHQDLDNLEMDLNLLEQTKINALFNTMTDLKVEFRGEGYFQAFFKGNSAFRTQIGIGTGKESELNIENDTTDDMTTLIHEGEVDWINKGLVVKNKLEVQTEDQSILNLTMNAGVDINGLAEFLLKGDFYYLLNDDVRFGSYVTIMASGNVADIRGGGLRAETGLSLDFDGVKLTAYTNFTTGDRLSGVLDYYEPATGSQYLSVSGPEVRAGFALNINHKLLEGGQKPQIDENLLKPGVRALTEEGIFIKDLTFTDPEQGAPGIGIANIDEDVTIENCNFSGSSNFAITIGLVNGNINIKDNTLNGAGINLSDVHGSITLSDNTISAGQAQSGLTTLMTDKVTVSGGSISGMQAIFVGAESEVDANNVEFDGMIQIVPQGELGINNNTFSSSSQIFDWDRQAIGLKNDPLGESGNSGLLADNIDSFGDWNEPHPCADYPPYRNVLLDPLDPGSCVQEGKTQ